MERLSRQELSNLLHFLSHAERRDEDDVVTVLRLGGTDAESCAMAVDLIYELVADHESVHGDDAAGCESCVFLERLVRAFDRQRLLLKVEARNE